MRTRNQRRHRNIGWALLVAGALSTVGSTINPGSSWAASDPGGNNGTVKVDGLDMDEHPNNHPHPGCAFLVEFYNYDQGDYWATVTFELQPPTTRAGDDQIILEDTVFIGGDPAGGGDDNDARKTYELTIDDVEPQPIQGHHIKLTVNAPGSRGADVKHKVFWVECGPGPLVTTTTTEPPTTTTTEPPATTTTEPPATTTTEPPATATNQPTPDVSVLGGTVPTTTTPVQVLGEQQERGVVELPRTGTRAEVFLVGMGFMLTGALFLGYGRRR